MGGVCACVLVCCHDDRKRAGYAKHLKCFTLTMTVKG